MKDNAKDFFKDSGLLAYYRGPKPPKAKAALPTFYVWCEGWSATGGSSDARLLGMFTAMTFREACYIAMCEEYLRSVKARRRDGEYYNPDRFDYDFTNLKIWGCRLFESEAEARKSFG